MSGMWDQFETSAELETKGVWAHYGAFRVLVAYAGNSNKSYLRYAEGKLKPYRRQIEQGTLTREASEPVLHDIYAQTVILAWQVKTGVNEETGEEIWQDGIEDRNGSIMPFNKMNVIKVFKAMPALFSDIQEFANAISNYRRVELETEAGNSSPT